MKQGEKGGGVIVKTGPASDRPGSTSGFIEIVFSDSRDARRGETAEAGPGPMPRLSPSAPPPPAPQSPSQPPPAPSRADTGGARAISFSRTAPGSISPRPGTEAPLVARATPAPLPDPERFPEPGRGEARQASTFAAPDWSPSQTPDYIPTETAIAPQAAPAAPQRQFSGWLDGIASGACQGWVFDKNAPHVRVEVEAVWGGEVIGRAIADQYRPRLLNSGIGDGRHAFALPIPPALEKSTEKNRALLVRTADGQVAIGTVTIPRAMNLGELVEEARECERKGDLDGALAHVEAALAIDGTLVKALWLGARVAYNLKDQEKARVLAERAAYLDPSNPRPAVILARIADTEGRTEDALRLWQTIPAGDTAYKESLVKSARHLLSFGRPLEALRASQKALRADGADKQARRSLADSYTALGANELALSAWRSFLELVPDDKTGLARIKTLEGLVSAGGGPAADDPDILLNSSLRDWRRGSKGSVTDREELTANVFLTPSTPGTAVSYQVCQPQEVRFDRLSHYGLRLHTEGAGFLLSFALSPNAPTVVGYGVRLSFEARTEGENPFLALGLRLTGTDGDGQPYDRAVWTGHAGPRARLLPFDFVLSAAECDMIAAGTLSLTMATSAPGTVVLHAPRRVQALVPPSPLHPGSEDAIAGRNLAALLGTPDRANAPASGPHIPPTRVGYPFVDIVVWGENGGTVGAAVAGGLLDNPVPFHAVILDGVSRPTPDAPDPAQRLERDSRVRRASNWSPRDATGEWICLLRADADLSGVDWLPELLDLAVTTGSPVGQAGRDQPAWILMQRAQMDAAWKAGGVQGQTEAEAQIRSIFASVPDRTDKIRI